MWQLNFLKRTADTKEWVIWFRTAPQMESQVGVPDFKGVRIWVIFLSQRVFSPLTLALTLALIPLVTIPLALALIPLVTIPLALALIPLLTIPLALALALIPLVLSRQSAQVSPLQAFSP